MSLSLPLNDFAYLLLSVHPILPFSFLNIWAHPWKERYYTMCNSEQEIIKVGKIYSHNTL